MSASSATSRGWPNRSIRSTRLTEGRIVASAKAHFRQFGRYPSALAGQVIDLPGETWARIQDALYRGNRGLRGGESLAAFLRRTVGKMRRMYKPVLSRDQIIRWARDHFARKCRWPSVTSGRADGATGETWSSLDAALRRGLRGLPSGSSLSQLLTKVVGPSRALRRRRLSVRQIVGWARKHHQRSGVWPVASSQPIPDAPTETWYAVQAALTLGQRGLPGGDSLSRLLQRYFRKLPGKQPVRIARSQILAWADAYHRKHGLWPHADSGSIDGVAGMTWNKIETYLRNPARGRPGGQSLAKLLIANRGGSARTRRSARADFARKRPLRLREVLLWAKAHARRTGQWPDRYDGRVIDAKGETWLGIDEALRLGQRGLPKVKSLGLLFSGLPKPRMFTMGHR